MTQAWLTLTSMDGRDIAAPTEAQLAAVLAELYAPLHQDKAKGKARSAPVPAPEPASAALRFGYDDGLMYVIEASSTPLAQAAQAAAAAPASGREECAVSTSISVFR